MSRPIWKGSISFGLIHIPVSLYSAESGKALHFKMLDRRDYAPIGYKLQNKVTGKEVDRRDVVKGYEVSSGEFVTLGPEDFKKANPEATQTIDIQDFVDSREIDPLYFGSPYYLAPQAKAEKGYVLLRETLKKTGKVAVTKLVMHSREHLAVVVAHEDSLVLHTLRFRDELKEFDDLDIPELREKKLKITDRELSMAKALVESMSARWKPEKYHDTYHDDLMKLIEYKAAHGNKAPARRAPKAERASNVIDMVALLKKSLDREKDHGGKTKPSRRRRA